MPADLAGAALAAFVSVTWLIPTLGISGTLWAVAGCKAVSLVALVTRSRVSAESLSFRMPLPMMLLGGVILLAIQSTHGPFQRFINSDGYRLVAILVLAAAMASAFEPMPWRRWIRQAEHRSRVFAERIGGLNRRRGRRDGRGLRGRRRRCGRGRGACHRRRGFRRRRGGCC